MLLGRFVHVVPCVQCSVLRKSGVVVVDLCWVDVMVVVFWAVYWFLRVDVGVHCCAYCQCVDVWEAEELQFVHYWSGRCSGWDIFDQSDESFLHSD